MICKILLLRVGNLRPRRLSSQLLLVLALSSLGCARGDWINQTLTLVDVTGTWEGPFRVEGSTRFEGTTRWVLQQKGGKVRGEAQRLDRAPVGAIEGLVNGEVFSWRLTGPFIPIPTSGYTSSRSYRGEATIAVDEMSGRADGPGCPCTVLPRRVGSDTSGEKAQ